MGPATQLDDGEIAYGMERPDDCLRPCMATVLQVAIDGVLDPRLDDRLAAGEPVDAIGRESWAMLEQWLAGRGRRLVVHESVPVDRARWIGVCRPPAVTEFIRTSKAGLPGASLAPMSVRRIFRELMVAAAAKELTEALTFGDHCLVMCRDRIIHDPAMRLPAPPGRRVYAYSPSDVVYGISIEPKE
jgi:hypothetical protein